VDGERLPRCRSCSSSAASASSRWRSGHRRVEGGLALHPLAFLFVQQPILLGLGPEARARRASGEPPPTWPPVRSVARVSRCSSRDTSSHPLQASAERREHGLLRTCRRGSLGNLRRGRVLLRLLLLHAAASSVSCLCQLSSWVAAQVAAVTLQLLGATVHLDRPGLNCCCCCSSSRLQTVEADEIGLVLAPAFSASSSRQFALAILAFSQPQHYGAIGLCLLGSLLLEVVTLLVSSSAGGQLGMASEASSRIRSAATVISSSVRCAPATCGRPAHHFLQTSEAVATLAISLIDLLPQ
jgi:hypothetical protein